MILLQVTLHRQGGRQRSHAQKIVSTSVAGSLFLYRYLGKSSRRLAQAGQGIKLSQETDDGSALSVAAGKSGGDVRQIALDLKAQSA